MTSNELDELVLCAIGSTEAQTFNKFCRGLNDQRPVKGESEKWRLIFEAVERCQSQRLVVVRRDHETNDIVSMQLTKAGADRIREKLDQSRGLFNL